MNAPHVTRYVATYINRDRMRTLVSPGQGRFTYATRGEAQAWLEAFMFANSWERIAEIFGPQSVRTFEVRPCRCWAGHFDPVGVWFD